MHRCNVDQTNAFRNMGSLSIEGKKQLGKVEAGKSSGIDANHPSAAAVCKLYFHN